MIRKLSLAMAVAAALSPLGVYALGLGDIHTRSALNQRFKADIDLLSVTQDEIQDIRVGLASPEAFAKAGIDRPFLLSGLKFTPSLAADGRMVITVSSQDPIREPFLNFLIEVNWPKGRMLREYTVLLDPPVTLQRRPAPTVSPRVTAAPSRKLPPVVRSDSAVLAGSYPATNSPSISAREYGPVQWNENLWQIAQDLKRQDETVEQVMMALQRYNPDAFLNANVNELKKGAILRLPADADVTGLSPRDARREFMSQTQEWRTRQSSKTAKAAVAEESTSQAPEEQKPSDRLKLIAAKPQAAEESQAGEGKAEDGEKVSRLQEEMLLVKEENASVRQENEVLHSRIKELEEQVTEFKRLLNLKNDQLKDLQTTSQLIDEKSEALESALEQDQAVAETELVEQPPVPDETPTVEDQVIQQVDIESVVMEAMQQAETSPEAEAVTQPKISSGISETAEPTLADAKPRAEPTPATPPASVKQTPVTKPVATDQSSRGSYLDILTGNTTLLGVIGAVVVLLSALLWLIVRRRKEAEAEFAESILVTPEGEEAVGAVHGAVGINEPSEETSFMSDFSPSDIDALQDETGEVDPISEADVYIAYGRYQQAEELIKQAIERFPEREELRHKLLEIYYSAKNTNEYNRLAEELRQSGTEQNKPDVWEKIAKMGRELDPGNPMFGIAAGAAAAVASASASDEIDDLDIQLDSSLTEAGTTADELDLPERAAESEDELSSIDLSDFGDLSEMESETADSSLSLDSGFLSSLEDEQEAATAQKDTDLGDLEINLDELDEAKDTIEEVEADSLQLASSLDSLSELSELDLSDMDTGEGAAKDETNEIALEDSESLDDLDLESLEKELELLSGEIDEPVAEEPASQVASLANEEVEANIDELDLDSSDDVTTKLDLARAYVDMGDPDGAKSILEEVVTEGSDQQKQEAEELLGTLSA